MFSKFVSRVNRATWLSAMPTRAFRASAVANGKGTQKPSIGDAVTILQSKVSGINQVVSNFKESVASTFCKHALFSKLRSRGSHLFSHWQRIRIHLTSGGTAWTCGCGALCFLTVTK